MSGTEARAAGFERSVRHAGEADGLAFRSTGPGPGPRLLLLHPLAMWGGFWTGTVAALGPGWQVAAPDLRGHGQSPKSPLPCPPERHAADLVALMVTLGWPDAVAAGASMGGCVALALAAAAPDRVSGLGLIDTTAWYGPDAHSRWAERGDQAVREGMASLLEFQLARWFSDGFRQRGGADIAQASEIFLANDVASYRQACAMLGAFDARVALPRLAMPASVIVGEADYATPPRMAQALAELLPAAELHVLPGLRHFTPIEAPRTIAGLLAGLAGRTTPLLTKV